MQVYEIRILNADFTSRTIIEQQYFSDVAAVRAARLFADPAPVEVWRGLSCVYAGGAPHSAEPSSPSRPVAGRGAS